jgi:hypothetical protein
VIANGGEDKGSHPMARVDRVNANRALAKAIAFKDCGKDQEAERWAIQLVRELQCAGILNAKAQSYE